MVTGPTAGPTTGPTTGPSSKLAVIRLKMDGPTGKNGLA